MLIIIRKWLEVPISGTLSNVYLTTNKFGLSVIQHRINVCSIKQPFELL